MKHLEETIKLLRHIELNPQATQRELVVKLDVSLGKVNFLVNALVGRGLIKLERFNNSKNKKAYLYLLTPAGIRQKSIYLRRYLEQKTLEYDRLREQINILKEQLANDGGRDESL